MAAYQGDLKLSRDLIAQTVKLEEGLDTDLSGKTGRLLLLNARFETDDETRLSVLRDASGYLTSEGSCGCEACLYTRACVLSALSQVEDEAGREKTLATAEEALRKCLTRLQHFPYELDSDAIRADRFLQPLLDRVGARTALDEWKWEPSRRFGPPPPTRPKLLDFSIPIIGAVYPHHFLPKRFTHSVLDERA